MSKFTPIQRPNLGTKLAAGMAMLMLMLMLMLPALAAAPQRKTAAPGFYTHMLGDFEITALTDGTSPLPDVDFATNLSPEDRDLILERNHFKLPSHFATNAYLINTGAKLVLVDAGMGVSKQKDWAMGRLLGNLRAAGYEPEQVDEVLLTHMHPDHVGGLLLDGKPLFPNALVRADVEELPAWQKRAEAGDAQAKLVVARLKPYVDAGRFKPFAADTAQAELLSGVRAVAAHGHTAGHSFFAIESKGQKLMLWGDLILSDVLQFARPDLRLDLEHDADAILLVRQRAYAEAAAQGYLIGAAHISFPGLGRLRADGNSYQWLPLIHSSQP
ncbi:MBL fold metallo-hydrolase [Roseateles oligotrophus]|uniref:MBL fold metallo-hydrolase n=1 Tax=Roseateles oligotrophus TaxID=1769250 RepID=A0ABT2YC73_9BURK|nr:MBL fold metallo-hydrolase [Roseateles oligotrophus]MCV2367634.1 MBL fold metallo-hydrolase [Roseateles oligotrophus]